MDIIITYVNGLDPIWQKDYEKYTNKPLLEKRFRDWGTLKYLLRGIEKYMPFIQNVYLVISHISQVPEWVDKSKLNVVLHKDFVPAEFLPTFNCNPLEMHLHRISGLSEEYIYFNDDTYPIDYLKPEDFYENGKITTGFTRHLLASGMFKKICHNSDSIARKALGMKSSHFFMRPQHICSPMLKSECEKLYNSVEKEIKDSITITREENNLNQYMFLDYLYYQDKAINRKQSKKHFSVAVTSPKSISKFIQYPDKKLICINDVSISEKRYTEIRAAILDSFEKKFPNPSKFEK